MFNNREQGNPCTPIESVNGLRCRSLVLSVGPCCITAAAVLLRSQSAQFKCEKGAAVAVFIQQVVQGNMV